MALYFAVRFRHSQLATPPWREHVPLWCWLKL
ncbi:protein of unknown function [Caballeronia sp. S22]